MEYPTIEQIYAVLSKMWWDEARSVYRERTREDIPALIAKERARIALLTDEQFLAETVNADG